MNWEPCTCLKWESYWTPGAKHLTSPGIPKFRYHTRCQAHSHALWASACLVQYSHCCTTWYLQYHVHCSIFPITAGLCSTPSLPDSSLMRLPKADAILNVCLHKWQTPARFGCSTKHWVPYDYSTAVSGTGMACMAAIGLGTTGLGLSANDNTQDM